MGFQNGTALINASVLFNELQTEDKILYNAINNYIYTIGGEKWRKMKKKSFSSNGLL